MNREIKFRALSIKNQWQTDEPKWVVGDLARQWDYGAQGSLYIDYFIHTFTGYDRPIQVDGETVTQYTGLKDKNGKEIYEGDIVNLPIDGEFHITEITFTVDRDFNGWEITPQHIQDGAAVLGNIHENPELIK